MTKIQYIEDLLLDGIANATTTDACLLQVTVFHEFMKALVLRYEAEYYLSMSTEKEVITEPID